MGFFFFSFGHDSATFGLARPELLMHPALDAPISPKSLRVTEPPVEIFFLSTSSPPVAKGARERGLQSVHHTLSLLLLPGGGFQQLLLLPESCCANPIHTETGHYSITTQITDFKRYAVLKRKVSVKECGKLLKS